MISRAAAAARAGCEAVDGDHQSGVCSTGRTPADTCVAGCRPYAFYLSITCADWTTPETTLAVARPTPYNETHRTRAEWLKLFG